MDDLESKSCTFEGRTYSHGSEVCVADKCMRCDAGEWEYSESTMYEGGCCC
jgi:hypothetical protein